MKKSLNIEGRILDLSEPKIMGIVNATPDSFYQESRALVSFEQKIDQMVAEGADIIDVGGYSTRPGAADISVQEEIDRVLPILEYAKRNHSLVPVSVDTFRSKVAEVSLLANANMINDVSGGDLDDQMWHLIAEYQVPYIIMHSRGNPQTMQNKENLTYKNLLVDVFQNLQAKIAQLRQFGIIDIIVDPGIGFAKDSCQNLELIKNIEIFKELGCPILIGLSRKSFIRKLLEIDVARSLNGSTILHTVSLLNGANILRVHDVREAVEARILLKSGDFI